MNTDHYHISNNSEVIDVTSRLLNDFTNHLKFKMQNQPAGYMPEAFVDSLMKIGDNLSIAYRSMEKLTGSINAVKSEALAGIAALDLTDKNMVTVSVYSLMKSFNDSLESDNNLDIIISGMTFIFIAHAVSARICSSSLCVSPKNN